MPESARRDPRAYNRFRKCIWDEFVIPTSILRGPPGRKSQYRLNLDLPASGLSTGADAHVCVPKTTAEETGPSQPSRRFFGLLGMKRDGQRGTAATTPSSAGLKKVEGGGAGKHHGLRLRPGGFRFSRTIRAGLDRMKHNLLDKITDDEPATLTVPAPVISPTTTSTSAALTTSLETPSSPSEPIPATPVSSSDSGKKLTLEALPVEILQEIFTQTNDPYSMVLLSLTSRHMLRVAAGMKSLTQTLSHNCIDGCLGHLRKYHDHTIHQSHHYRITKSPAPCMEADMRIFKFLTLLGPPIEDPKSFNVCMNCRKWKSTEYSTAIKRAEKSGGRHMVIEGTRRYVRPEAYIVMWAHRPHAVDHFCPQCLYAKAKKDEKEKDKELVDGSKEDTVVEEPPSPSPVKGRRYRRIRRRGTDT